MTTNVELSSIQPPADELLDHADVHRAAERLARSPRVRVEELGHSHEGRVVNAIVVGRPDVVADPGPVQELARCWSLPFPQDDGDATWPEDTPIPVLFVASNYGNEAAQTEALVQIAQRVAEDTPENQRLLDRLVVLIVPLLNPDGRERALETWRRHPAATAVTAYGNHYDVQVAREYLHLLEPETAALAELVRRWHPVLVWEVHEDSINLGRQFDETCLCPPMSPADRIGSWIANGPGDNDPRLWHQEVKYGAAIAAAWRAGGYRLLHDPDGRHGWPRSAVPGLEQRPKQPETRFTRAMLLRGVTTFITESARRPGTQTWEERVGQKVDAGAAILTTAADDVATLTRIVRDVGEAATTGPDEVFWIPADQDPGVVERAVSILRAHDIQVLAADASGGYVVPHSQPRRGTAEVLLSLDHGRHQSLVATLGLHVLDSRLDRRAAEAADGAAAEVDDPPPTPHTAPRVAAAGTPRVAVYAGQGVKDFAAEGHLGSVRRLLDRTGLPFVLLEADAVRAGQLDEFDVLVVPKGDPDAVLEGSRPGPLWYGPPWDQEEETRGLGADGAAAIGAFVDRGGHYIGVDGGAVLATRRHLALIDCDVSADYLGTGLVELTVDAPDDPLFDGLTGSWDEAGSWRDGLIHAMIDCEAWLGEPGATVLSAGQGVQQLATFSRLLPVRGVAHFAGALPEGPAQRRAAIVRGRRGAGTVTLFAVNPTYRSLSPLSARLLANAVRAPF
ncbi:M14 family zinc carboxypeptidase [Jiangella aurantiaca]|uniref:M14 family zinc carboxypeptidase n=1 Tax=Jiangella aurantiaca TaxID=2530373 RepID=UPI0013A5CD1C|nr:M14 family zinc carboxypeptidase [Jiangella aurantiaca]